MSELVAVEAAGNVRPRTQRALETTSRGEFVGPRPTNGVVPRAVDRFIAEASLEQVPALVGFVRHRGQYGHASKALGLHRNTLRYRVARARGLVGLELDDPDVFAETWLALRARGVA
jgi:PucR family transcriptional regulator, purine catabolism regulatory protein